MNTNCGVDVIISLRLLYILPHELNGYHFALSPGQNEYNTPAMDEKSFLSTTMRVLYCEQESGRACGRGEGAKGGEKDTEYHVII